MSRFGKLLALAVVVCCATASFAATTVQVVDQFGNPVTTDVVAIIDGAKVALGMDPNGTFTIDADPGDTITFYSKGLDKAEIVINNDGDTTVTLPPVFDRATCDVATPIALPSVTPFDTTGAGPHGATTCTTTLDPADDGLWFSVVGDGSRLVASTCNDAGYDTKIAVFCQDCAAPTCIDGNDDGAGCAGFTSNLEWDSQAGATYHILVTGFLGATGAGNLTVDTVGGNAGTPVQCVTTGACCTPGDCTQTTEADCDAAGGSYLGDGEPCTTIEGGDAYVSNPGAPIPDAGGGSISDTINVPDSFTISDLDVDFITDHTWVGDLTITVQSPAATSVTLSIGGLGVLGNLCEGESTADIFFDDEGPGDFDDGASCTGTGNPLTGAAPGPSGALSAFDGEDAAGPWVITVQDENTLDTGSLLQWSLHFNATEVSNCSGACCTDAPGVASDCIETSQDDCEADNGLFVGGSCDLIEDCLPLYVEFDSVSAKRNADGTVNIEWTTSTEIDTVGFRVLRETGGREKTRMQVGGIVFSNGDGLNGGSYSVLDREGADATRYFLVDIDALGRETTHGPFDVETTGRRVRGARVAR